VCFVALNLYTQYYYTYKPRVKRSLVYSCLYLQHFLFLFLFHIHNSSTLCRSVSCTEVSNPYQLYIVYHLYTFLYTYLFTTLHTCSPSLFSCTAYEGSACSSVFSSANLTATSQSQIAMDTTIDTYFTALSVASILLPISQDCLNYLRFTRCLSVFTPCSGTAWCGSMNGTELTEALNSACGCSGSSCTVGGLPVATFRNYYQGSSSTGQVNNGTLYCQDVTVGKRYTCTDIYMYCNVIKMYKANHCAVSPVAIRTLQYSCCIVLNMHDLGC